MLLLNVFFSSVQMSLGICLYRSDKIADSHVMLTTAFDMFDETVCNPAPRFKLIADSGTRMKLRAIYIPM